MGRPEVAVPLLRTAVAEIEAELPRSGSVVHRRRNLIEALLALKQLDEAQALFGLSNAGWQRYTEGVNQPWMNSNLLVTQARLRLAQGRPADAVAVLQQIVPSRLPPDAPLDLWLLRRDVLLAEAWLALNDSAQTIDIAQRALRSLGSIAAPYRLPHLEASAWLVLGQAQQRRGDVAAARISMQRALALRVAHDDAASLWLKQTRQALAALGG